MVEADQAVQVDEVLHADVDILSTSRHQLIGVLTYLTPLEKDAATGADLSGSLLLSTRSLITSAIEELLFYR